MNSSLVTSLVDVVHEQGVEGAGELSVHVHRGVSLQSEVEIVQDQCTEQYSCIIYWIY